MSGAEPYPAGFFQVSGFSRFQDSFWTGLIQKPVGPVWTQNPLSGFELGKKILLDINIKIVALLRRNTLTFFKNFTFIFKQNFNF